MGFSDFAGSTLVHSTGGWYALAGAIVLGARKGKYNADGSVNPCRIKFTIGDPGNLYPVVWLVWFQWGFATGTRSAADATAIAIVYVNTNLAAAGGVVAAMLATGEIWQNRPHLRS